ncbi:hypothetical protein HYV49_05095 [Candidatus Pacearchaeota archaeon]|nr:hypothetical protein [Candidatus Pacearchaeota archaeon]
MPAKENKQRESGMFNNKILIWVIVAVIIILLLFFIFKGGKNGEETTTTSTTVDIDTLDVGDNPDTGVDDFSELDVSQEDIFP